METQPNNVRDSLIKFFKAGPGEKPLNDQEFKEIKNLVNLRTRGFNYEAYEKFKDDKELVKAALDSQISKGKERLRSAPEIREPLIKLLKSKEGEKVISKEEYKLVVGFVDFKDGGLNKTGFEIFRDDKEVIAAAKENKAHHRAQAKEISKEQSKPPLPTLSEAKERAQQRLDEIRGRRGASVSRGPTKQPEIGD
jgi:hypothetical protein